MAPYMKIKPYQFGLATISGFWDHSSVTRLRTDRNQLVNIYLMVTMEEPKVAGLFQENMLIFISLIFSGQARCHHSWEFSFYSFGKFNVEFTSFIFISFFAPNLYPIATQRCKMESRIWSKTSKFDHWAWKGIRWVWKSFSESVKDTNFQNMGLKSVECCNGFETDPKIGC